MKCCGKPLRQEGKQWVCRKCGKWFQGAVAPLLALVTDRFGSYGGGR